MEQNKTEPNKTKKSELKYRSLLGDIWHYFKVVLVYLFYVLEYVAWKKVGEPVYKVLSQLKIMDRFRVWVNSVDNRYALLLIFVNVFVLMEITSTYGLVLIGTGAIVTGIALYLVKLVLMVPAVVIWNSAKKPLLSFWLIRFVFGWIIRLRRSSMFRSAKRQIKKIKLGFIQFKDDYLNGNGELGFTDSIKAIYKNIKAK